MTGTPRLLALSNLLPAFSPATTKSVLLLTLLAGRPPKRVIRALISSRLKYSSDPVTTMVFPAIGLADRSVPSPLRFRQDHADILEFLKGSRSVFAVTEPMNAIGNRPPNLMDSRQVLVRGLHQFGDRWVLTGDQLGNARANVANGDRSQARERVLARDCR